LTIYGGGLISVNTAIYRISGEIKVEMNDTTYYLKYINRLCFTEVTQEAFVSIDPSALTRVKNSYCRARLVRGSYYQDLTKRICPGILCTSVN